MDRVTASVFAVGEAGALSEVDFHGEPSLGDVKVQGCPHEIQKRIFFPLGREPRKRKIQIMAENTQSGRDGV